MSQLPADLSIADRIEAELIQLAAECALDPLRFALAAFPWGQPGSPLEHFPGPEQWQRDALSDVGKAVASPSRRGRFAVAAANGVGKSTYGAILILWALVTCPDTRVIVLANNSEQVIKRTFAELAKWHQLCLWSDWFAMSATSLVSSDPNHERTWRADAVLWSAERPEAVAGMHNAGKRLLVLLDEASGIPDVIWTTLQGAMSDANTDLLFVALANPTRTSGAFFDCFHGQKSRWNTRQIDARDVSLTDKAQIEDYIADYGIDSDLVRVRVRGVFPRRESLQFIGADIIEGARTREVLFLPDDPLIIGADIARQGGDSSVICFRRGLDARSIPWLKFRSPDLMQVAAAIADADRQHAADAIFVDAGGLGAGVYDRLLQLGIRHVFPVQFGARSDRIDYSTSPVKVANKRAEIWSSMREWLSAGAIPNDPELLSGLAGPMFTYDAQERLILERKDDMRKRGLASPDEADSLATTFAMPVAPRRTPGGPWQPRKVKVDYDPFEAA